MRGFEGHTVRLLTLTIPPQATIGDGLAVINAGFNRLMTRIRRRYPRIMYLKVLEFQKATQSPHFHLLVNRYIPQAWLAENAEQCGLGRICDIRATSPGGARQYVLKYLKKGFSDDEALEALLQRKGRRYSFSRGFPPELKACRWWMIHPGFNCNPEFAAALWRLHFITGVAHKNAQVTPLGPWCFDLSIESPYPGGVVPPDPVRPPHARRAPSHRDLLARVTQQHPFTWGVPHSAAPPRGRRG